MVELMVQPFYVGRGNEDKSGPKYSRRSGDFDDCGLRRHFRASPVDGEGKSFIKFGNEDPSRVRKMEISSNVRSHYTNRTGICREQGACGEDLRSGDRPNVRRQ